jgi:hypothetical protein
MRVDFNTAYTDEQGHYQIQGLGDGPFTVIADAVHRGFVRMGLPLDLDKDAKKAQLDITLSPGVAASGRFVDEKGRDWQLASSYCTATVTGYKKDKSEPLGFNLSCFGNKYRHKDLPHGPGDADFSVQGHCTGGYLTFPTKSTFVIQGMIPGQTTFRLLPNKEGQRLVKILYEGRDITKSGIQTKPGQEIKDVTFVIGPGTTSPERSIYDRLLDWIK